MRSNMRLLALGVAIGVLGWTGQGSAGTVIEQVAMGNRWRVEQRVLLDANRMKTLMLGSDGHPVRAFILDLNTGSIIHADYAGGQYVTGSVQEYVQLMRWLRQKAWEQVAETMRRVQEQAKNLPAEERKGMEEMLQAQRREADKLPRDCREFRIEVRRTGQQATIAGYPAVRYDVLADGALRSEVWLARGIPGWRELDARKFEQFARAMAKLGTCGPEDAHQWFFAADPGSTASNEGFPVRIIDRGGSGGTIEAVKTEVRAIPRAEFEPPADLGRRTFREIIGP